jgi:hypothetical protein
MINSNQKSDSYNIDDYNIFSIQKLNSLIDEQGFIKGDIVIRGNEIKTLGNLKKVYGSLGIDSNTLENLGDLIYVKKDFWITNGTSLKSLNKLERVGGDVNLSKSNIDDLGDLSFVGKKLSLRNIDVDDLSKLKKVKTLFLSNKLKLINIDHIDKSVVRYWADKKNENEVNINFLKDVGGNNLRYNIFIPKDEETDRLSRFGWDIFWDSKKGFEIWLLKFKISSNPMNNYYVSKEMIDQQNENFNYYKHQIDTNSEYLSSFKKTIEISNLRDRIIYELLQELVKGKIEFEELIERLHYYDKVFERFKLNDKYIFLPIYELLDKNEIIESILDNDNKTLGFSKLHELELRLKKRQIKGKTIVGNGSFLNEYIKKNLNEYYDFIDEKLDEIYGDNYSFFYALFGEIKSVDSINKEFPKKFKIDSISYTSKSLLTKRKESFEYINQNIDKPLFQKYYRVLEKYNNEEVYIMKSKRWNNGDIWLSFNDNPLSYTNLNPDEFIYFIENILHNIFTSIVLCSQNDFRIFKGMPKIGEGWVSETDLFYKIKAHFVNDQVIQHASPKWLGRQHLDIYFPKYNVGIEYQGKQHSEPISFFGGEISYLKTLERDERKNRLCMENNCSLFYVYPETNVEFFMFELDNFISNLKIK